MKTKLVPMRKPLAMARIMPTIYRADSERKTRCESKDELP